MQPRSDQFAAMRGLLALWILFGHMLLHERFAGIYDAGFARHEDFGLLGHFIVLRFLSVDLFFMLSGFVLTLYYADRFHTARGRDIDRFYWRRLKRIYPMHVATMAVIGLYALLGIAHPITSHNEAILFQHWQWTGALNLLLMNGWGFIPVASWNEPAWSLSITFLIYVLYPNLVLLVKRLPAKAAWYLALALVLPLAYAAFMYFLPLASQSDGAGAIMRGIVFSTMGIATALYARSTRDNWGRFSWFIPPAFVGLIAVWTYVQAFPIVVFHLLYPALLLALYFAKKRLFPVPLAQWFGTRSFAIFMTHYPTLLFIRHVGAAQLSAMAAQGGFVKAGAYALVVAACLLVADIAYRLLDKPFHGRE